MGLSYGLVGGGALLGAWAAYAAALKGLLSILPEYAIAAMLVSPVLKKLSLEKSESECEEVEKSAMDMVGTVAMIVETGEIVELHFDGIWPEPVRE